MGEPFKTDYIWAGFCLLGAVYFMFRNWDLARANRIENLRECS
jgi:hypothetical protein